MRDPSIHTHIWKQKFVKDDDMLRVYYTQLGVYIWSNLEAGTEDMIMQTHTMRVVSGMRSHITHHNVYIRTAPSINVRWRRWKKK